MPIATPQGTLDFKSVDKVTFVGASSNTVIDTTTGSLGVGVGVNGPTSNLHVVGHTRLEGDIDMLHTANTASIKLNSNVVTEFPRSKKLIKYPRVALTQNALNSGYTVFQSGTNANEHRKAWSLFNNNVATDDQYHAVPQSGESNPYNPSTGAYEPDTGFEDGLGDVAGEYVYVVMPDKIKLQGVSVHPRDGVLARSAESARFMGSNDGTNWVNLGGYTNYVWASGSQEPGNFFRVDSDGYYNYIGVVWTKVKGGSGGDTVNMAEVQFFGVPEYDPEAHGTDVVVKSEANVPNTDWLEVYYDGQDYTTMPATVDNKTGVSAYDATPSGGVGFDAEYKAFTFNSSSNQYLSMSTPMNGNYVHSMSMWFKPTNLTAGSGDAILFVGTNGNNTKVEVFMESDRINYTFGSNNYQAYPNLQNGRWYHLTLTYNGQVGQNGREIYLDGKQLQGTHDGNSSVLALTTNNLDLGRYTPSGSSTAYAFDGSIANFRLFNRALSQDEIYQLYAYQKEYFGHGDLSMTLKAGRLGIGTSEPRAALDVRGDVAGRFTRFLTYDHVVHSSTTFNSSPSWPIGQSLSLVSHTWDIPTEYAALGRGTLNGYAYVSWSGSCPNPWQAVFWIDIYYNGVYMGRGSTNSDVGNTSANHGNTTVALTYHAEENNSTLDSANVTTGFRLPNCNLSRGSTIKIDLVCQRGDYQSGENVVWTNRNHTAPSSNARDYEQGTTNFFVLLNVE